MTDNNELEEYDNNDLVKIVNYHYCSLDFVLDLVSNFNIEDVSTGVDKSENGLRDFAVRRFLFDALFNDFFPVFVKVGK